MRTPLGWVGRIDNHIAKKTAHVPVLGQPERELYQNAYRLLNEHKRTAKLNQLFDEQCELRLEEEAWYEEDDPIEETVRWPGSSQNDAGRPVFQRSNE